MPPGNYACYNTTFASAVITAKMLGQKTFDFMGKKVKVADHIKGVKSDLEWGKYKIYARRVR